MKPLRIELICVGTELLTGKLDTHGSTLGRFAESQGLSLALQTVVGDDAAEMRRVFREAWRRSGVVICAGGLGPTFDDITRRVWSRVLRRRLRFKPDLLREIRDKFRRRGLRMPAENKWQAFVLSGAGVISNAHGTAPGQLLTVGPKALVLLPGPSQEMWPMAERALIPLFRRLGGAARKTAAYRIFGVPESVVDERLDRIRARFRSGVVWGILAEKSVVSIKAAVSARTPADLQARLAGIERGIHRTFGKDVFGRGDESLELVVGALLRKKRQCLSVAESCTGGLLAEKITRIPGSSDYFLQGYVAYSNESKVRHLGVHQKTLDRFGAVSDRCALEMARGYRRRSGADWTLAVTGIAGPSGALPGKPVGLVFIALAGPRGARVKRQKFQGGREDIRERSALFALDWLRRELARH